MNFATSMENDVQKESTTEQFEYFLNRLAINDGILSTANIIKLDSQSSFPIDAALQLDRFGLNHFYVPEEYGGRLESYEELMQLWRCVSNHDLTLAIGHGKTFLGTVCVWLAATKEQASKFANAVLLGDVVSWGLTEKQHGSDLLAGELTAEKNNNGWCINGEKWLINNATRGQQICLLARTSEIGGARGFSLFLVDKQKLSSEQFRYLAKEKTYGIRGADISGIAFDNVNIDDEALIGQVGSGIETVLKALQLTRTNCVALSLGAADQAIRLTINYVKQREIYARHLQDLPNVQAIIGKSIATLFLVEAVSRVATRSIHALPSEMSVISAITKAFVPTLVDSLIYQLGELLGLRAYLLDEYADGIFQKLERDHRLVAIFDGSTVVNQNSLINQFPMLIRAHKAKACNQVGLSHALDIQKPLASFKADRLKLISKDGCSLVQSLPEAIKQIQQANISESIKKMAKTFLEHVNSLMGDLTNKTSPTRFASAEAFELAHRYEWCFAGSACLQLWLRNVDVEKQNNKTKKFWQDELWLKACLALVLDFFQGSDNINDSGQSYQQLFLQYSQVANESIVSFLPHINRCPE